MCAINPKFKKRMVFDFYTSHKMSKEEFEAAILKYCLDAELTINKYGKIRCHVKETKEEAE